MNKCCGGYIESRTYARGAAGRAMESSFSHSRTLPEIFCARGCSRRIRIAIVTRYSGDKFGGTCTKIKIAKMFNFCWTFGSAVRRKCYTHTIWATNVSTCILIIFSLILPHHHTLLLSFFPDLLIHLSSN